MRKLLLSELLQSYQVFVACFVRRLVNLMIELFYLFSDLFNFSFKLTSFSFGFFSPCLKRLSVDFFKAKLQIFNRFFVIN